MGELRCIVCGRLDGGTCRSASSQVGSVGATAWPRWQTIRPGVAAHGIAVTNLIGDRSTDAVSGLSSS